MYVVTFPLDSPCHHCQRCHNEQTRTARRCLAFFQRFICRHIWQYFIASPPRFVFFSSEAPFILNLVMTGVKSLSVYGLVYLSQPGLLMGEVYVLPSEECAWDQIAERLQHDRTPRNVTKTAEMCLCWDRSYQD